MLNPAEMADSTPMAIFLETLYFKPPTSDKPNPSDAEELLDREMLDNWLLPSKLGLMDLLLLVLKLTFFNNKKKEIVAIFLSHLFLSKKF